MTTSPPLAPLPRHALGLPAGSVRAILTFMVLGIVWALLAMPEEKPVSIPLYLYYLMFLVLGHYFAARGHSHAVVGDRREPPPLYLPRGSIRTLIVLGFGAVIGWGYYHNPDFLERLQPTDAQKQPFLPLVVLGAFFVGILVSRIGHRLMTRPGGIPAWFLDIQAWISLLAVLGLGAEYLFRLVINPTLNDRQLSLDTWSGFLGALVAFYFGARS